MEKLLMNEVENHLKNTPGWHVENGELTRTFTFNDFVAALYFVNQVGNLAEEIGHHPDIQIKYNKVKLNIMTHDAGGITNKDFQLINKINSTQIN